MHTAITSANWNLLDAIKRYVDKGNTTRLPVVLAHHLATFRNFLFTMGRERIVTPDAQSINCARGGSFTVGQIESESEMPNPGIAPVSHILGLRSGKAALFSIPGNVLRIGWLCAYLLRVKVIPRNPLFKTNSDVAIGRSRKLAQQTEITHRGVFSKNGPDLLNESVPDVLKTAQPNKHIAIRKSISLHIGEVRPDRLFHSWLNRLWVAKIATLQHGKGEQARKRDAHRKTFLTSAICGGELLNFTRSLHV